MDVLNLSSGIVNIDFSNLFKQFSKKKFKNIKQGFFKINLKYFLKNF